MDRLSEIQARFEEAKAGNARGYMIPTADVEYLLAEIERLRGLLAERNVLLDKYEEENRWVSVSERLPEDEDGEILVIASGKPHKNITLDGAYMLATYSRPEGWILDEYPEWECARITHWRPLPEPPKGE